MQIIGVPFGAKISRIGMLGQQDWFLDQYGNVEKANGYPGADTFRNFIVLVPADDNFYCKFLHLVEIDIRKAGRERLGGDDYRIPLKGEEYWAINWPQPVRHEGTLEISLRIILKPLLSVPMARKRVIMAVLPVEGNHVHFPGSGEDSPSHVDYLLKNWPKIYRLVESK